MQSLRPTYLVTAAGTISHKVTSRASVFDNVSCPAALASVSHALSICPLLNSILLLIGADR